YLSDFPSISPAGRLSLNFVQSIGGYKRPFQFQKHSQLFIGAHNEPLSVAPMRVSNPDCAPSIVRSNYATRPPGTQTRIVTKRRRRGPPRDAQLSAPALHLPTPRATG